MTIEAVVDTVMEIIVETIPVVRGNDSGERRNSARRKCSYRGLNRHTEENAEENIGIRRMQNAARTAEQSKRNGDPE